VTTATAQTAQRPPTAVEQALAVQRRKQKELAELITSRREAFAMVAGKHFEPDRLVKLAQGALARQPKLVECTASSVLVALMRCAELDLEPDSALPQKRMWLVPRNNKNIGQKECTYIIDYRAQLQLARQTGLVASVVAMEVRERDIFNLYYDAEGTSIAKFDLHLGGNGGAFADRGLVVGYFAAARLESGEVQICAMSKKDAELFRDRHAPRYNRAIVGPWVDDFDPMAIKTCLRKLWNLLPAGKSEAARKLQEQLETENQIADGTPVQATAPIELDLGMPVETGGMEESVERALGIDGLPGEPKDEVQGFPGDAPPATNGNGSSIWARIRALDPAMPEAQLVAIVKGSTNKMIRSQLVEADIETVAKALEKFKKDDIPF
jgi:recombination protein RecT